VSTSPLSGRPRLLFLSHRLPYPPHNGASIRTYHTLRQLAQEFDVVMLCFDRVDPALRDTAIADRIAGLSPWATVRAFPIPEEHSLLQLAWTHVRSLATRLPYVHFVHESAAFEEALRGELSSGTFDLVHIDSLDLQRFLPSVRHLPVVCTHHNAESVLLERRAARAPGPRAWYLGYQAALLARGESTLLPRIDLNITTSEVDASLLQEQAPSARIAVVPNGVDTEFFTPSQNGAGLGCVFVGGTTWFPNRDGLDWFAAEILPQMRSAGITAPVQWVGRVTDAERTQFAALPGVSFTGYVDDVRPHVWGAACFIAPLRVGGGTRLKILDAWAMGMPVVATGIACEGLDAVPGENILVANDVAGFVEAVSRVLTEPALRARLGAGGRATVERTYSWNVIGANLRRLYHDVIARRAQYGTPTPAH
jgi:glycosyltransferase involved in cell wall biosynthesis